MPLERQETIDKLALDGSAPPGGTQQAFVDYLKAGHAKRGKVIREARIKRE